MFHASVVSIYLLVHSKNDQLLNNCLKGKGCWPGTGDSVTTRALPLRSSCCKECISVSVSGFLHLGATDIFGWMTLCSGGTVLAVGYLAASLATNCYVPAAPLPKCGSQKRCPGIAKYPRGRGQSFHWFESIYLSKSCKSKLLKSYRHTSFSLPSAYTRYMHNGQFTAVFW